MAAKYKSTLIAMILVFTMAFLVPSLCFPTTAWALSSSSDLDVVTDDADDITDDEATLSAYVDGYDEDEYEITVYGFFYGANESDVDDVETILEDEEDSWDCDYEDGDDYTSDAEDEFEFTLNLNNLDTDEETYYYRAYIEFTDGDDNEYYALGAINEFDVDSGTSGTSSDGDLEVVTDDADVNDDEATLSAYVDGYDEDDFEISEYGFFYGVDEDDVDDVENILEDGDDNWDCDYDEGDDYTSDDEDEFEFTLDLNNLDTDEETYYYRAYIEYEDEDGDEYYALGDIEQFDVGKGEVEATPSIFTIGSTSYTLGGSYRMMDVAPYIKDNRTYLPLRYVGYAMGLADSQIIWSPLAPQTVTLNNGSTNVILNIGSRTMYRNGTPITMDVVPELTNNRTCLPIAWIASAFGYTATWDGVRTVTISGGTTVSSDGDVELDDDSITLEPGEDETVTGTLDADGLDIDDVEWDIDGDKVVSVDVDIDGETFDATVEVDDDADDGDECTITFTVTDTDGNDYEVELDVTVEDDSSGGGDLDVSDDSITIDTSEDDTVTVKVYMPEDYTTDDIDGSVTWDSDDSDIADIDDYDEMDDYVKLTVIGDEEGDTSITIYMTIDGDDYEVTIDVTVEN